MQRCRSSETNDVTDDADEKFRQMVGMFLKKKLKKKPKPNKRNVKVTDPGNESLPSRLVGHCAELLRKAVFPQSAELLRDGKESADLPIQLSDSAVKLVGKEEIGSAGESGSDTTMDSSRLEMELEEGELSSSSVVSSDSEEYQSCPEETGGAIPMQQGTDWKTQEPDAEAAY